MVRQAEKATNLTGTAAARFRVFFDELASSAMSKTKNFAVFRFSNDEGADSYATVATELL